MMNSGASLVSPPGEAGDLPLLLSPGRVAEELGLSRATIYNLIADGTLPAVHVTEKRLGIKRQDFLDYVEGLTPAR